jgi:SH3-like domain-containing protein
MIISPLYLMSPHILQYLRREYFQGNGVSDKGGGEGWVQQGCLSARDRAITRAILNRLVEPKIHPAIE